MNRVACAHVIVCLALVASTPGTASGQLSTDPRLRPEGRLVLAWHQTDIVQSEIELDDLGLGMRMNEAINLNVYEHGFVAFSQRRQMPVLCGPFPADPRTGSCLPAPPPTEVTLEALLGDEVAALQHDLIEAGVKTLPPVAEAPTRDLLSSSARGILIEYPPQWLRELLAPYPRWQHYFRPRTTPFAFYPGSDDAADAVWEVVGDFLDETFAPCGDQRCAAGATCEDPATGSCRYVFLNGGTYPVELSTP